MTNHEDAPAVATAIAQWRSQLADRRSTSPLADLTVATSAVVGLESAHPSGIAQLFAGRRTRLSNLIRQPEALARGRKHAAALAARVEEAGTDAPALIVGVARVRLPRDGATTAHSDDALVRIPVLMRPVGLVPQGIDIDIALDPALRINPVLVRYLNAHGSFDVEAILATAFGEYGFDPRAALKQLRELLKQADPDCELTEELFIGMFDDPDRDELADFDALDIANHEVLRALAGDEDAIAAVGAAMPVLDCHEGDIATERGIGDLGQIERGVVELVGAGRHLYLAAPVGCDIDLVVAAIAADAAAAGRSVVIASASPHAATNHEVTLINHGLESLLLDPRVGSTWPADQARRLFATMSTTPVPLDVDRIARVQAALNKRRTQLVEYVAALHTEREEWHASAYDALQALARLSAREDGPRTQVRLDVTVATQLNSERRAQAASELTRVALLGAFTSRDDAAPWFEAALSSAEATSRAFEAAARLVTKGIPAAQAAAARISEQTGLTLASCFAKLGEQLELLQSVRATLDIFAPEVFERSVHDYIAATASPAWRQENNITVRHFARRRLVKQAQDLLRPGVPVADLHGALVQVARAQRAWKALGGEDTWPIVLTGLTEQLRDNAESRADLELLTQALATTDIGGDLATMPFDDLEIAFSRLAADDDTLANLPERNALLAVLRRRGLEPLLADLRQREVPAQLVADELDLAWWTTALEHILAADPALALDGEALETLVGQYAELDRYHVFSRAQALLADVSAQVARIASDKEGGAPALFDALMSGRLASLREAVTHHPVVRRLRPVLSVPLATLPAMLPARRTEDVVIVDVRGGVDVVSTLGAIGRGRQIVVVGEVVGTENDGSAACALARALPVIALPSLPCPRDPYLTAFLAARGYGDRCALSTSSPSQPLLTFDLVDGSGVPDPITGAVESNASEVDAVVAMVIDHAVDSAGSLAVIAGTKVHAEAIRMGIEHAARSTPALSGYLAKTQREPFVVTHVSEVGNLRRDTVIVSLGVAKTPHGRVLYRFGALSEPGGDLALLAALAVTRHRLRVVSAIASDDLDQGRLRNAGTKLLAEFLAFAQLRSQGATIATGSLATPSPLLVQDLANRLRELGMSVETGYGITGGPYIPLAVGVDNKLCVAVITDDEAYVNEPNVRIRDRLAPAALEQLGWFVVRVFAAAMFADPQAQAAKVAAAVADVIAPPPVAVKVSPQAVVDEDDLELAEEGATSPAGSRPASADVAASTRTSARRTARTRRSQVEAPRAKVRATGSAGSVVSPAAEAGISREVEQQGKSSGRRQEVDQAQEAAEDVAGASAGGSTTTDLFGGDGPGTRPDVSRGLAVTSYSASDIDKLTRWLLADGTQWDEKRLLQGLRHELGITRRGARVDAILRASVRRVFTAR